ncbi:hypothetical protein SAMN05878482_10479 [Peribacillus simplex]|uniref:Uncharacterized protein n=1 Tax=Peribacillus simplex TaxID=1478 RepID=A0A9X8WL02_9BACI|nr:hypothetical protein SAMN05878482_10479 [Peribacillus simplex]
MLMEKSELQEDEHALISALHDLVSKYEAPDSSYSLQDIDAEFLAGMNKVVQGCKIKIKKIEAMRKRNRLRSHLFQLINN